MDKDDSAVSAGSIFGHQSFILRTGFGAESTTMKVEQAGRVAVRSVFGIEGDRYLNTVSGENENIISLNAQAGRIITGSQHKTVGDFRGFLGESSRASRTC